MPGKGSIPNPKRLPHLLPKIRLRQTYFCCSQRWHFDDSETTSPQVRQSTTICCSPVVRIDPLWPEAKEWFKPHKCSLCLCALVDCTKFC